MPQRRQAQPIIPAASFDHLVNAGKQTGWCRSVLPTGLSVLSHLPGGRTARRLPELRRGTLPIEGVIARTVLLQMRQPRDGLFHAWPMAGRHPPQRDGRSLKMLEPVGATAVEALVYGLPDEVLQRGDVFPDRQIDDDERVSKRPRVGGVAAVVDIAPDEARAARGEAI